MRSPALCADAPKPVGLVSAEPELFVPSWLEAEDEPEGQEEAVLDTEAPVRGLKHT